VEVVFGGSGPAFNVAQFFEHSYPETVELYPDLESELYPDLESELYPDLELELYPDLELDLYSDLDLESYPDLASEFDFVSRIISCAGI
jgi:hypothetical protein